MPEYLDAIDANQFWGADECDIFRLEVVALALGIGRNRMYLIPVNPIMVNKIKCYRKKEILDWALAEQVKGKDNLLIQLRAKNSLIGRYEKTRSRAYDYYYTSSNDSYYRPNSEKGETKKEIYNRLRLEWLGRVYNPSNPPILEQLESCNDENELKRLIKIAWEYREQFINLRMGLPYGIRLGKWWFEKDFDSVLKARLVAKRATLQRCIEYQQESLNDLIINGLPSYIEAPENTDISVLINRMILSVRQDIEQLSAELKELG